MRMTMIALALLLSSLSGLAQAQSEASYPRAIRDELNDARRQCARIDKGKITLKPQTVRKPRVDSLKSD